MYGPVKLHTVGMETHCRLHKCWFLVMLLLQSVFSMADTYSMANGSPLACDCVVETRFGKGPFRWELQFHPSIFTQEGTKWCEAFVPKQEYSCKVPSSLLPACPVVCWHLECLFTGRRVWKSSGVCAHGASQCVRVCCV